MDLSSNLTASWTHPCALTTFLTSALAALLAIVVLRKNSGSSAARQFAIMCSCVAVWAFWLAQAFIAPTNEHATIYVRVGDGVALFIPITYLHFVMHFVGRIKPNLLKAAYTITTLLVLTAGSPWFVPGVQWKYGMWFTVGGPTFLLFVIQYILLACYGMYLIYQETQTSQGTRKAQLSCLLAASIVGFGGGFMWFPPCFGIDIPPLGGHLVALYCAAIMYGIVRYRFLDIQVVIRKSLIYSILITLLTVTYFGSIYGIEKLFQVAFGYQSVWISLAAFALMALLFQPLKVGIQRLVDLLIFRVPQEQLVKHVERLEEQALLGEKLKAVSTMVAGMAHEIKNPLTAIRTFTEFIPEKKSDPAFLKNLHEVLSAETRRIQEIVQEVLNFAKPRDPRPEPLNIEGLLNSTVNLLSSELLKRRIKWAVDCQHNGSLVHADPDQLRQVLINLIQNAADAMPEGGKLDLKTQAVNGHVELVVSDTGKGVPKELLPKIFDPFVTTKEDGNGLGLAMVYSILKANRGTIHAESEVGKGTTFTVGLPI